MKIFRTIEMNMVFGGFIRNQSAYNRRQWCEIFKTVVAIILQLAYLFHVANTPKQFMDSIFMTTSVILIAISYNSIILKYTELFEFIDDLQQVIDKSECQPWNVE